MGSSLPHPAPSPGTQRYSTEVARPQHRHQCGHHLNLCRGFHPGTGTGCPHTTPQAPPFSLLWLAACDHQVLQEEVRWPRVSSQTSSGGFGEPAPHLRALQIHTSSVRPRLAWHSLPLRSPVTCHVAGEGRMGPAQEGSPGFPQQSPLTI